MWIYIYIYVYKCIYIYVDINTYIYIYIYTCMCMCVHTRVLLMLLVYCLNVYVYGAEALVIDVAADLLLPLPTVAVSLFGTTGNSGFPEIMVLFFSDHSANVHVELHIRAISSGGAPCTGCLHERPPPIRGWELSSLRFTQPKTLLPPRREAGPEGFLTQSECEMLRKVAHTTELARASRQEVL